MNIIKNLRFLSIAILVVLSLAGCGNTNEYTVSFNANGGTNLPLATTDGKSIITLPNNPVKEGFTFDGWYLDNNTFNSAFTTNSFIDSPLSTNITVYAKWIINTYNINFVDFDDTIIKTVNIEFDSSLSNSLIPLNPDRVGYSFIGWDSELPATMPAENITIQATYSINQYTITFEENGGTVVSDISEDYSTLISAPSSSKDGYILNGWFSDTELTLPYEFDTMPATNLTLYAKWEPKNYAISFDSLGGSHIDNITLTFGENIPKLPIPSKEGYDFVGWFRNQELTTPFTDTVMPLNNFTLYAKWIEIYNGFLYETINETVTIIGYKGQETNLVIPDTISEYPVTKIADDAFKDNVTIVSLIIGQYVTTIGNNVFSGMSSLETIEFPNLTKAFGISIMDGTTKLSSLTISSETTYSLKYLFGDDFNLISESLTTIKYALGASSINFALFQDDPKNATTLELASDMTEISDNQFQNVAYITQIILPDSITSIGQYAFSNMTSLTSIVIPNSVLHIGIAAFNGASSLTSISLPFIGESPDATEANALFGYIFGVNSYDGGTLTNQFIESTYKFINYYIPTSLVTVTITGTTSIPNGAFSGDKNITNIIISKNVTNIGDYAFYNTILLSSVTFEPESQLTSIGYKAFYKTPALTQIDLPSSLTSIGSFAFYEANGLTSITIPSAVTSIGSYAFAHTFSLTSITFEAGSQLTIIDERAFNAAYYLESIIIPLGVTSIGDYAFSGDYALISVTFEDESQLTTIGDSAFEENTALTNIIIPNSVTYIGSNAFYHDYLLTIYAKADSQPIGWDVSWNASNSPIVWGILGGNTFDDFNYVTTSNNTVIITGQSILSINNNLIIPNEIDGNPVTIISDNAFNNKTSIISVEIPITVIIIGKNAFSNCSSLITINIPNSVTNIGSYSFANTSLLTSIILPISVINIGQYAFYNSFGLTIYAEATSEPANWQLYWNFSNLPVVWGYTE